MTMMGILQVASYIYKRYMDDFGVRIDEMKLQIWEKLRIKEEGVAYDTWQYRRIGTTVAHESVPS